jgi:S1-C subfamily serine protease
VITSVAGADLTKESNPGSALVQKMRELEPDLKVKVDVLRDGKKMSFDVTPRPAPQGLVIRRGGPDVMIGGQGMPGMPGVRGSGGPMVQGRPGELRRDGPAGDPQGGIIERRIEIRRGDDSEARFDGIEFASLSERLGSYFGVKAGVLVVRAGANSPLKLQDGDVILAIDGREATTAQQAGRILRSYQPGEKLTLKVQRDRKTQNVDGTAPGGGRPN